MKKYKSKLSEVSAQLNIGDIKSVCELLHSNIADYFPNDDEEFVFKNLVEYFKKHYLK
jgi:hypothetical protein